MSTFKSNYIERHAQEYLAAKQDTKLAYEALRQAQDKVSVAQEELKEAEVALMSYVGANITERNLIVRGVLVSVRFGVGIKVSEFETNAIAQKAIITTT